MIYKAVEIDHNSVDIHYIYKKCKVIYEFINSVEGNFFLKSFKRVLNILESEYKILKDVEGTKISTGMFKSKYEQDLFKIFNDNKQKYLEYNGLIPSLISLSKPINNFFEKVQINDKNILLKKNRLCLLSNIKNYVIQEIDFSKIIKGKEL